MVDGGTNTLRHLTISRSYIFKGNRENGVSHEENRIYSSATTVYASCRKHEAVDRKARRHGA